jgi:hypothetical protein
MEPDEIIARAKEGTNLPANWIVLPVLRGKLVIEVAQWAFGLIMGAGILALFFPIIVPYDYLHGAGLAVFGTIVLGACLFIAIACLYLLWVDVRRLFHSDQYRIIITPEDFVKQEGKKVVHVPLAYVRYVTARGKAPVESTMPTAEETDVSNVAGVGENVSALFFGRWLTRSGKRWRMTRARTPSSVAFIDSRNNKEITVVNDTTYGDPHAIGEVLKQYTEDAGIK